MTYPTLLNEEEMEFPRTATYALSQHLVPGADTSETPHLDGTAEANSQTEDPGFLEFEPINPAEY